MSLLTIRDTIQDRQTGYVGAVCVEARIGGTRTALGKERGEGQSSGKARGGDQAGPQHVGLELHYEEQR